MNTFRIWLESKESLTNEIILALTRTFQMLQPEEWWLSKVYSTWKHVPPGVEDFQVITYCKPIGETNKFAAEISITQYKGVDTTKYDIKEGNPNVELNVTVKIEGTPIGHTQVRTPYEAVKFILKTVRDY